MAKRFIPLPEEEGNAPQSAQIFEFPLLWQAEAEVRRCKMMMDRCTHTIDTGGVGRLNPELAVTMAESLLADYTKDHARAEAVALAMSAGSALTHNGVVYSETAGRA